MHESEQLQQDVKREYVLLITDWAELKERTNRLLHPLSGEERQKLKKLMAEQTAMLMAIENHIDRNLDLENENGH